jgi:hypothetical protein
VLIYSRSLLFGVLWYTPTRDGEQRVLRFAVVTAFDLLALLIFLFERQIRHWHDVLDDIEQGHQGGSIDDISAIVAGQGDEQLEQNDLGARPEHELGYDMNLRNVVSIGNETIRANDSGRPGGPIDARSSDLRIGSRKPIRTLGGDEVAMRRNDTGWANEQMRPVSAEQEVADRELGQPQRAFSNYIDLGTTSGDIHVPRAPGAIIPGGIHPLFRANGTASLPGDEFCSATGPRPLEMIAPEPEHGQF